MSRRGSVAAIGCAALFVACAQPREPDAGSAAILLDPQHPAWSETSPDSFDVRVETTKGHFVIAVHRGWAPLGADRFYNLVRHGYYDDARFHRVVPDFIVQWGIAGDPAVTEVWSSRTIADDPVVANNTRGSVAFAFTEPGTRSTQVFVSLVELTRLDSQGFAPFGRVVQGMEVVDALHSAYGEGSGGGVRAGAQDSLVAGGNAYLDRMFPDLDRIVRATIANGEPR
jgi:homoserine O-acetyltransferase